MRPDASPLAVDVVVVGGGQAGLAVGYYLRRTGLSFVILDAGSEPGGAWPHAWDSLRLFSPAAFSSLPGWMMSGGPEHYPTRDEAIAYLARYQERYELPVERPVRVQAVRGDGDDLVVETDRERWRTAAVVSATGTWSAPYTPEYPGQAEFGGRQLHSARYRSAEGVRGQRVLVVGGGNSGAQVMAEVSQVADATWVTRDPPTFMPDHVDGRVLFDRATAGYRARQNGGDALPPPSLGDIVVVAPVREARERAALESVRPFRRFTEDGVVWSDGREEKIDAVIWCTGFRPALDHLKALDVFQPNGRVAVNETRSVGEPRLWLVGYGEWTGFASATLIGVGRSARATVEEIAETLAPVRAAR